MLPHGDVYVSCDARVCACVCVCACVRMCDYGLSIHKGFSLTHYLPFTYIPFTFSECIYFCHVGLSLLLFYASDVGGSKLSNQHELK